MLQAFHGEGKEDLKRTSTRGTREGGRRKETFFLARLSRSCVPEFAFSVRKLNISVLFYCRIDDPNERASLEAQILEFGQTPKQLFTSPHPQKLVNDFFFFKFFFLLAACLAVHHN